MPHTARPGFVVLVHDETGATSQPVPESTVHIWEERGWRRGDLDCDVSRDTDLQERSQRYDASTAVCSTRSVAASGRSPRNSTHCFLSAR